jgi:hypothetical protein
MTGGASMPTTKNNDVNFIILSPAMFLDCAFDYLRHLPNNKDD